MLELIVFTILIATIINIVLHKIQMPTIIGYILTGTIISYIFHLHTVHNDDLKLIGEFGIVFMMFTIGLEMSIENLIKMKKDVFLIGGFQVTISAIFIGFVLFLLFHVELKIAILIGGALSLSSTAIVLKILNENKDINKLYGKKTLGILLFQDIAVIPMILMITIFSSSGISITHLLIETFTKAFVLFAIIVISGKYLLEFFLQKVVNTNSNEIFIGSILFLVMGSSSIAHQLGFSYSLGAFLAGIMIAETHYKHQVETDLIPFRDLLLGVFFISVGMQLSLNYILEHLGIIFFLLSILALIKMLVIFFILKFEVDSRVSLKSAISLFQLGEFGLVVFELSSSNGLVSNELAQIFIATIILSMVLTPFVIKNISNIADKILKIQGVDSIICNEDIKDHVVLIGFGKLGTSIASLLEKNRINYIAIEQNISAVENAAKEGKNIIFGNSMQKNILESAKVQDSKAVIIAVEHSDKLNIICQTIKSLKQDANIILKVNRFEEKEDLKDFNLSHIIVETEQTALSMYNEFVKHNK